MWWSGGNGAMNAFKLEAREVEEGHMRWRQRPDETRRAMAVVMTMIPRAKVTKREQTDKKKKKKSRALGFHRHLPITSRAVRP